MAEKLYLGLTQEQATELNSYFLEKPAKEAIPYLKIIQNLPTITVVTGEKIEGALEKSEDTPNTDFEPAVV